MQCGTCHLQTVQENSPRKHTVTYNFSDINKWQMPLCNNLSDNKSYWIHRVDVKVSAQVTTVTYMQQSQPSWRNSIIVNGNQADQERVVFVRGIHVCWKSFTRSYSLIARALIQGRKEMFYLTTHSTHFFLRLNGVRHMVKDHSDSEKGNPLPPRRLLFPINSKGSFICTIPTDRIAHTPAFVTPVMEHWLEREIDQWVHHEG